MKKLKHWAFMDKETGLIMPVDVCPIFPTRTEAREEKKKLSNYYSNTKIVAVYITPVTK